MPFRKAYGSVDSVMKGRLRLKELWSSMTSLNMGYQFFNQARYTRSKNEAGVI